MTRASPKGRKVRPPEESGMALNFLVIDDHVLFRQGLAMVMEDIYPDAAIHEASSLSEAVALAADLNIIDAVLLDLVLPDSTGFSGLNFLTEHLPDTPVIVISSVEDPIDINAAFHNGARGYIPKSSSSTVLRHALSLVLSGETFLPSNLALKIEPLHQVNPFRGGPHPTIEQGGPVLTRRQKQVLDLVAQGRTNKEIARVMGIEEGTVKVHVKAVMDRLGANNRTHAVINASRLGLVHQAVNFAD